MPPDLLAVRVDRQAAIIQDTRDGGACDRAVCEALLEVGTVRRVELVEWAHTTHTLLERVPAAMMSSFRLIRHPSSCLW